MHYTYILDCNDSSTYVGCTSDLKRRIKEHNEGKIKHTQKKRPVELLCYFAHKNKYIAFDLERYFKSGSGRAFLNKHIFLRE